MNFRPGVIKMVKVYIAMKRKLSVGDKMAGRHGNKGVIARILPEEDMPYLPDGTPRRDRAESARRAFAYERRSDPRDAPWLGSAQARQEVAEMAAQAENANEIREIFKARFKDTAALNQLLELDDEMTVRVAAGMKQGIWFGTAVFDGARETRDQGAACSGWPALLGQDRTVRRHDRRAVRAAGHRRLHLHAEAVHLVDDKIHARSIGPYSLITQQPLGGKAQFGGQRFGEMEVWALEAYGAAYILQELLTAKSDDVFGRTKIYEAIVKGEAAIEPGVPESFNVLIRELQSLCLDVELVKQEDLKKIPMLPDRGRRRLSSREGAEGCTVLGSTSRHSAKL